MPTSPAPNAVLLLKLPTRVSLSPGGCTDLLAMTLFVDALEREGASRS